MSKQTQIPKGWVKCTIGDVYDFEYGKALKKENRNEKGIFPVLGSNGRVGLHDDFLVEGPGIIIGRKGAAGEVTLVKENFWPIDTTYYVRFKSNQSSVSFSYYLLKSQQLNQFEKSTAIPGLNRNDAYEKEILLPPLHEQHVIVSKIEQLFSELDKGIESLKTAQQQLKVYRQSVLKSAFEGKPVVATPMISKLGEHVELITKGASPRWQGFNYLDDESQLLFITSENVRENYLDVSEPKYLSLEFNKIQKRSILKNGDVLFNLVGASIGRAAVFNLNRITNINQAVAIIRLQDTINNKYLSYFLNSEIAKHKYLEKIVDVARANLSLADVAKIEIPLFSIPEQHQIVQEIESRLSECDNMEATIATSLQQAEALRQSILKKAFEGRLLNDEELEAVRQDPAWEPAERLLERIRVEKAVLHSGKKGRKSKA